jgi:hypothetical protein
MAVDHYSTVGAEYRKESIRLQTRVLFFGLVLLLSHLLEIKPSEFDAGGLKVVIKDVSVIRGGISLVFLYHFWNFVEATFQGSAMLPMKSNQRTLRFLLSVAKRPYKNEKTKKMVRRNPRQVKRHAWWSMTAYLVFLTPFAFAMLAVIALALFFGVQDAWAFAEFAWKRSIEIS